mgnify:CR=1 FL=1
MGGESSEEEREEREERERRETVSYTHLTLPTNTVTCRSRWSPYH